MVERDGEIGNTIAKIEELQNKINQLDMQTFYSKYVNKRKRPDGDVGDRGTNGHGRAWHGGATDCEELGAELGAHGYEVEPQEIKDENGYVIIEPFFKVCQPLSTYAPR
jgi:hypothetical protein